MADDLRTALSELVESWRDDAWGYQRAGRPELRDLTYRGTPISSPSCSSRSTTDPPHL